MRGVDFETATRGSGTAGTPGSGWWSLYGPRVLVSLAVVAVLSGAAQSTRAEWGAGVLRDPGLFACPSACPYSPECVEGKFREVRG
jgi:hypothetical protein